MSNVISRDDDSSPEAASGDPTGRYLVYFAAERTLMAWIRAALGLMALGFVIDRFGLVVRTVSPQVGKAAQPTALSLVGGAGLVVVGVLMAAVAAVRYAHFARRYRESGDVNPGFGLTPALVFTVIVALIGAFVASYLITAAPYL